MPPEKDGAPYRAFLLDENGHIFQRIELECCNDEAAIHEANKLLDGHDIEIWHGPRLVNRLSAPE